MHLQRLKVRHLRNLTSVSLEPARGLNIIRGRNGSGKTSLLEAIHLLGLARSFRSIKTSNIVQNGKDSITLFAEIGDGGHIHRLGVQRYRDNRLIMRVDGENLKRRAELARMLPLQLITPESITLLTGSPRERRQFLDWAMFHVEPNFHPAWSRYERAIKQRNALLRKGLRRELAFWDSQLLSEGQLIHQLRRNTLSLLQPHIDRFTCQLLPDITLSVDYRPGWSRKLGSFESALNHSIDRDLRHGYTSVGPHRADLQFLVEGSHVADHFSRGQLKLLVCALRLAQMAYLRESSGKSAVVLLDDLPAELDLQHRTLLIALLHELDNQIFVTATDRLELDSEGWGEIKVFHVEHGEFQEVV